MQEPYTMPTSGCKKKKRRWSLALTLVLGSAGNLAAHAADERPETYDIWIKGGLVYDGTGAAPVQADVLVKGDTIVRIGAVADVKALRVIDASGQAVAPGFIDLHSHGDPLSDLSFANFLTQGITTVVLGQDGSTPGVSDDRAGNADYSMAQWLDDAGRSRLQPNVAMLVGHGSLRTLAGVGVSPQPTEQQMNAMQRMLRESLDAGAFGMSTGLEYVPGRYASTEELIALADTVGRADGLVVSHLRSEDSDRIVAALEELIAQSGRARVHVSHVKIVFAREAQEGQRVLDLLDAARKRGVAITADVYPYLAGYGSLALVYPPWAKTREEWDAAVASDRPKLEAYLRDRIELRGGAKAILFAQPPYTNITLAQLAQRTQQSPEDVVIDVIGFGGPSAAHFNMRQDVQDRFIAWEHASIATDGGPTLRHPRSWGTFPKVLQEYVRERKLLTMEEAIRKMSGLPASILKLPRRGQLREGYFADIVVFSPQTVRSQATWDEPSSPATGIAAVIVNGCVAAEFSSMRETSCGRVLRKARKDPEPTSGRTWR